MTDHNTSGDAMPAANEETVPRAALDEMAEECQRAAWLTLTRIASDHRHCDCSGSYPCEVSRVVHQFGQEFKPGAAR